VDLDPYELAGVTAPISERQDPAGFVRVKDATSSCQAIQPERGTSLLVAVLPIEENGDA
jgi:hypothetical protein